MLSKSSFDLEAQISMLQEETNLFLIAKIVLIVMVPIWINKDMAEPNYNYLKFKVWNRNYFCTNLMFSWSFVLICLEQLQLKIVQSPS